MQMTCSAHPRRWWRLTVRGLVSSTKITWHFGKAGEVPKEWEGEMGVGWFHQAIQSNGFTKPRYSSTSDPGVTYPADVIKAFGENLPFYERLYPVRIKLVWPSWPCQQNFGFMTLKVRLRCFDLKISQFSLPFFKSVNSASLKTLNFNSVFSEINKIKKNFEERMTTSTQNSGINNCQLHSLFI